MFLKYFGKNLEKFWKNLREIEKEILNDSRKIMEIGSPCINKCKFSWIQINS